jgi:mRNA interferase RelE/StbE
VESYKVLIKPSAARELEALPAKDRLHVAGKIQLLGENPRPHGCEKLSAEEKYRIRQAQYRVVNSVSDDDCAVLIVKVGHRREVYCWQRRPFSTWQGRQNESAP